MLLGGVHLGDAAGGCSWGVPLGECCRGHAECRGEVRLREWRWGVRLGSAPPQGSSRNLNDCPSPQACAHHKKAVLNFRGTIGRLRMEGETADLPDSIEEEMAVIRYILAGAYPTDALNAWRAARATS